MSGRDIILLIDDPNWKKARGLGPRLKRAARAALAHCDFPDNFPDESSLTVLLGSDAKLRALNRNFRGKNKPTNVLSFPASPNQGGYRGDIALAYGVTAREAKAAGKSLGDHAAHLVVHGVLHLAGYDHVRARDAKIMEPLEVAILAGLGIADPYRNADRAARKAVP
jgi:probable rRNA maturation factor